MMRFSYMTAHGKEMMSESGGQATFYYNMSIEQFVPESHPLRSIGL